MKSELWESFLLTSLFDIEYGNKFDRNKMEERENSNIAFISRTAQNNGISTYVEEVDGVKPYDAGLITVALGGSIGSSFLQCQPFYTAQNIAVLIPKICMSTATILFIITLIKKESDVRFVAFGRELNKHIKTDFSIKLPVTSDGQPNWKYMDNYITKIENKKRKNKEILRNSLFTSNNKNRLDFLEISKWKMFYVEDIFEIKNGKGLTKEEIDDNPGSIPAVQSGETNCGCIGYINREYCLEMNYTFVDEPCLTVARSGTAGYVGFQNAGCVVGDSAKILLLKNKEKANCFIYLFLRTVLMANKYKYDFGRKVTEDKYYKEILALPIKEKNSKEPDWDFMECYMRTLPYGDRIR